ncbi:MAG TPA: TetR family transcriptional regulator [Oceanospirillales bacterium]|nr:TetR family transcriptional regulator [Oceanospirillaceae bacterium]HBS42572.1 TetR family transcriptional regulator [Oceanospirillales bacterium]|tara:strand:- start:126 stop:773 length:648 start_codon:yes stop_codon:yes gene_type:complete
MARRTKEEAQQTRETIIEAAETVFHRKGVSATSLNDIAREAGFTRGAVYWHFRNKHDIFVAMVDDLMSSFDVFHQQIVNPDEPDPLGRFYQLLLHLNHEIVHNPRWRRRYEIIFLKCERTEDNEVLTQKHREKYQEGTLRIRAALQQAIRKHQLPAELDVDQAVLQLHIQLTGMIYISLVIPDMFDLEKESQRILDTYFCGLKTCFGTVNIPGSG